MHVVFLSHAARLSGAEIGLLRFVEASRDRLRATVLLAEDGDLVDALREAGADVRVMPLAERARGLRRAQVRPGRAQGAAALSLLRYGAELRSAMRRLRPDVVHTVSLKAGVYGSFAARSARVPVVWHLHDHLSADYVGAKQAAAVRRLAGTLPDGLLTPSHSVLATVGRRRRGQVSDVMPFPLTLGDEPPPVRAAVTTVGMLGRLTPWKGQDVFLDAFARAFPSPTVRARVIGSAMFGETDFEQALRARARHLGIADRVEFTGFRADVDAELRQLDVLVHASVLADPLPGVVLEGMAAGVPVIAANAGGNPEHLRHGVNGLLHRPGDADDLARCLVLAAGPAAFRQRLAAAARSSVALYSPEVIVPRMLDFYTQVVR